MTATFEQKVSWLEHLMGAAEITGEFEIVAAANLLQQKPAGQPLSASLFDLHAFEFALKVVPDQVGDRDVVWLVPRTNATDEAWQPLGVSEHAALVNETERRELVLGLAILAEASRTLRQRLLGDDWLTDFVHGEESIGALAVRLGCDADDLAALCERLPDALVRIKRHTLAAFSPRVRLQRLAQRSDEEAVWQGLLSELAEARADERPVAVWVAPMWVVDLLSPYLRDVLPLLHRWAQSYPGLTSLAEALAGGDLDAASLVAEQLLGRERKAQLEREQNESQVGIATIVNGRGEHVARLIDTASLPADRLDPRLLQPTADALIVLLNPLAVETAYVLERLLCDVEAKFLSVEVCVPGLASDAGGPHVVSTPLTLQINGGGRLQRIATPLTDETLEPGVVLALPCLAYLDALDAEPTLRREQIVGTVLSGSDQNDALLQWMSMAAQPVGDDEGEAYSPTSEPAACRQYWLTGDDILAARRTHSAAAVALLRKWLGSTKSATQRPSNAGASGTGSEVTRRAREDLLLSPPTRFRV